MLRVTVRLWALAVLAASMAGCAREARPLRMQDTLEERRGGVLYLLGKVEGGRITATDAHESLALTVRNQASGEEFILPHTRRTVRGPMGSNPRTELPEYVLTSLPIGTYQILRLDYEDSFSRAGFEIDQPVLRFHVISDTVTYIGLLAYERPKIPRRDAAVGAGWITYLDETALARKDIEWYYPNVHDQIEGRFRSATYLSAR